MEENLSTGNEAETHAETQKTTRVGNVRRLCDLFVLLESFCIGVLDEDVEHHEVLSGIAQDGLLNWAGSGCTIRYVLSGDVPVVILAKLVRVQSKQEKAVFNFFALTNFKDDPEPGPMKSQTINLFNVLLNFTARVGFTRVGRPEMSLCRLIFN